MLMPGHECGSDKSSFLDPRSIPFLLQLPTKPHQRPPSRRHRRLEIGQHRAAPIVFFVFCVLIGVREAGGTFCPG